MAKKKKLKKAKRAKAKKAKRPAKAKKVKKAKKGKKVKKAKKTKNAKGKKTKAVKKAAKAKPRSAGVKKPMKKPISTEKRQAVSAASAAVMQRLIGKVVHYYDRIGVAIIDLKEPLKIGDMIMLKKGDMIIPQRVESMEINHAPVASAVRGDQVGLKVDAEAHEGTLVLPG